jgi:hypothetical protein
LFCQKEQKAQETLVVDFQTLNEDHAGHFGVANQHHFKFDLQSLLQTTIYEVTFHPSTFGSTR